MSPRLINIQRFCIHDGPGIRTTIFFKGCSLHCPWCANPESISYSIEYGIDSDKCLKNEKGCSVNTSCSVCNKNVITDLDFQKCEVNAIIKYGEDCSIEEIHKIVEKDNSYYGKFGGVTYSGGEALMHLHKFPDLFIPLYERYHVAIETSLYAPLDYLKRVEKFINLFIIDLKTSLSEDYSRIIGGKIEIFEKNLDYLIKQNRSSDIILRIPAIKGITDKPNNIKRINEIVTNCQPLEVQIFSIHNLAINKYKKLNIKYTRFEEYTLEELVNLKELIDYSAIKILKL